MTPELHLFIVWERAAPFVQPIMNDILTKFTVKKAFQIHWTPSYFPHNLSRFYGQQLPPGSEKELHCGNGPFFCIIVADEQPVYGLRQTSRGPAIVNTNVFDAKALYRHWTGGGHLIHATNTPQESAHDLNLLIGWDPNIFLKAFPGAWDGQCPVLKQDLAGTLGWRDLKQVLAVLNSTSDYVILRNFEQLPDRFISEQHGDIDLLVRNPIDIAYLLNGDLVFREPERVHYRILIGGQLVYFDFRYVGDGYMDEEWERSLLRNRTFSPKGFYTPNPEDCFYSLLYHAVIHKRSVAPDYFARLCEMAKRLKLADFDASTLLDPARLQLFMNRYLNDRRYRYTVPRDPSVYFNQRFIERKQTAL
ncbi:hypothetical protein [Cohnella sp. AR92]|uniref:hypothetical protein n=1 Tax=Cohnella sp. AR92 TaxID=648716 RepID=UPI000F8D1967|nr:hypothetical protein [Cohnella sp. AR92]RUS46470.1 hypothetical protein ELR57_15485 [Cohnella sp. AR92]